MYFTPLFWGEITPVKPIYKAMDRFKEKQLHLQPVGVHLVASPGSSIGPVQHRKNLDGISTDLRAVVV